MAEERGGGGVGAGGRDSAEAGFVLHVRRDEQRHQVGSAVMPRETHTRA